MSADRLNEHESRGRGIHPPAGVEGLSSLNELHDFKVVDGEPDIRGWHLLGIDRLKAGKVHDLLVDTAAMKVRYLDVELDREAAGGVKDRHVLVPIGMVQLDDENDEVRLAGGLSTAQLVAMPVHDHRLLNRDQERDLVGRFGTLGAAATAGTLAGAPPPRDAIPPHDATPAREADFYGQPHFDDAALRRRRAAGDATTAGDSRTAGGIDEESRYFRRSEE